MGAERGQFLVLVLASILSCSITLAVSANPHSSDCMKNPFATGCRGISAKRSTLPSWPLVESSSGSASDLYRLMAAPAQTSGWQSADRVGGGGARSSGSSQQEMAQLRLEQLANAVELLVEVTSRLVALSPSEQQQLAGVGGRRLCRNLYSFEADSFQARKPIALSGPAHKEEVK